MLFAKADMGILHACKREVEPGVLIDTNRDDDLWKVIHFGIQQKLTSKDKEDDRYPAVPSPKTTGAAQYGRADTKSIGHTVSTLR